jgi:hypothetical protein
MITRLLAKNDAWLNHANAAAANSLDNGSNGNELPSLVYQLYPIAFVALHLADEDGLAVGDSPLLPGVGSDFVEGKRDVVEGHPAYLEVFFFIGLASQVVDGGGLLDLERPYLETPQLGEICAAAHLLTQVVGKSPDIGAG